MRDYHWIMTLESGEGRDAYRVTTDGVITPKDGQTRSELFAEISDMAIDALNSDGSGNRLGISSPVIFYSLEPDHLD